MGNKNSPPYRFSASEARDMGEIEMWRESHNMNIACKNAIECAIRNGFDGMHLADECAANVIKEYGFRRTAFVLSNTVQQKMYDGRFSSTHKEWANRTQIGDSEIHKYDYVVESHPAILDGFITEFQQELDKLHMFNQSQCIPLLGLELEGKVLALKPDAMNEAAWDPKNQLWLAEGGFGCKASAIGTAIFATCVGDGERARWNRGNFMGVLKDEFLPDWAKEKLAEYLEPSQGLDIEMK